METCSEPKPAVRVICSVNGCKKQCRTFTRCLKRISGVPLVKEMLRQNGKKEKRRIPITVKAFLCESCCPYLPLMGYRTFKVDKGKVWFGDVMEIDSQSETQNCAVSASQLANGSLVYSVAWVDDKRKDRHFTSES